MTTLIPFADIVGNEPACRLIGPDGAGAIEWVGSPYTVINAAHATGLDGANWAPATRENPPTCAIGPATGVVGVEDLPAWRDLACFAEAHPHIVCTDDAALWAAGVIIALNQTGILL